MLHIAFAAILVCIVQFAPASAQTDANPSTYSFGHDVGFVENKGQYPAEVRFAASVPGATVFLTDHDVRFALRSSEAVFLRFDPQASSCTAREAEMPPTAPFDASNPLPGRYHSLLGNDPLRWTRDARAFGRVTRRSVAPHIDAVFRIRDKKFEYDLLIHPGARPEDLRITFDGIVRIEDRDDGSFRVHTERGAFTHGAIRAFVVDSGDRSRAIAARLQVADTTSLRLVAPDSIRAGEYVLDPILDFATYLGWSATADVPFDVAVGENGNVYAVGMVISPEFPISPGTYSTGMIAGGEVMIVQLDAGGTNLVYSTAIGGIGSEIGNALQLLPDGRAVVAGVTGSLNFPVTPNAYLKSSFGPLDAFVLVLSADGTSLLGSTYFGAPGSGLHVDQNGLAVDAAGRIYIVGYQIGAAGIPVTPDAVFPTQNPGDCYLSILSNDLSTLQYCTYIGGPMGDTFPTVAVDASGGIFVAGSTTGQFPVTPGAFDVTHAPNNGGDFFVIKLKPMGQGIRYATYIGGIDSEEFPRLAATSDGKATLVGLTYSFDFPATPGSFDPTYDGIHGVTLTQLNAQGNALTYSGFIHSGDNALGYSLKLDPGGSAYVAGPSSPNFVTSPDAFDTTPNGLPGGDAVLTRVDPTGSSIVYATYFGGTGNTEYGWAVGVNSQRKVALAGQTNSLDLPVTPGAYQPSLNLGSVPGVFSDGFVAAFDLCNGAFSSYGTGCAGSSSPPALSGSGCPAAGSTVAITLANAPPGAPAAFFLGLGQGTLPLNAQCALQIAPLFPSFVVTFAVPPAGALTLSSPLPVPLPKTSLYFQALTADPSAPAGIAASQPLRMTIGD